MKQNVIRFILSAVIYYIVDTMSDTVLVVPNDSLIGVSGCLPPLFGLMWGMPAAIGSTVIGNGTKIDNLVHIGHNCKIGANCLIVAQTGISGSTIVGHNVTFGGQVGTVGHITIGANSVYAARSGITNNMPENMFCAGFPVQGHAEWLRMQVAMKKLPELVKKVRQLEKQLAALNKRHEH